MSPKPCLGCVDLQCRLGEAQEERDREAGAVDRLENALVDANLDKDAAIERAEAVNSSRLLMIVAQGARQREDAAVERGVAAEALVEVQQENEAELVNACIWNLEQCPGDHCNDVTRVHDRLLKRRKELAGEEGCTCGGVLRHPCGPKCLTPAEVQKEGD